MGDLQLMQRIKTNYGAAIAAVCKNSSVQPDFLAALIAAPNSVADLRAWLYAKFSKDQVAAAVEADDDGN